MAIHILGNGPSIRLFDRNTWPETDVFVGCNFSDEALRPHYTVISDVRPMKHFRGNPNSRRVLNIPAVITTRANRYIQKDTGGWDKVQEGYINVVDVMPLIRDRNIARRFAMNSGQHAVAYAIKHSDGNHDSVHLWGIDSFWTTDIQSSTDKIVRPSHKGSREKPHVTEQWMKYWLKIFDDHRSYKFMIHHPSGVKVRNDIATKKNVRLSEE